VGAGIVDEDYRGPLVVVVFNLGDIPFLVKQGDRIAQLICKKIVCLGANVI
jgi:dUTPase